MHHLPPDENKVELKQIQVTKDKKISPLKQSQLINEYQNGSRKGWHKSERIH